MKSFRPVAICAVAGLVLTGMAAAIALAASAAFNASAGTDWPCYTGPSGDRVSTETGWQSRWPDGGPKVLWKKAVGKGYSSLAVVEGKVYTMGNRDGKDTVYCLDAATGKPVWDKSYPAEAGDDEYKGPRSTPAVDGGLVYTVSRQGRVGCWDAQSGQPKWSKEAEKDFSSSPPQWGFAGSPVVVDKWVIVDLGVVVALDKATGEVAWKSRPHKPGYSTPVVFQMGSNRALAAFEGDGLVILNLRDGKELARLPWKTDYDVNAATPIVSDGKVFISSGYGAGCALLDATKSNLPAVWKGKQMSNHFASCVLYNGLLFGIDGNVGKGVLKCLNFADGKEKWSQRGINPGGLMLADGKLLVLNDKGELMVVEAGGDGFKKLSGAKVLGPTCWTMPVLSGGRILCRNAGGDLVCLDVSGK